MKPIVTYFFIVFALMVSTSAFASAVVVDVKGSVAFKTGNRWQPLSSGATLNVGTKVSTGLNSSAVLKFGKHTLTVKPLSVVEILESSLTASKDSTTIGLKRGGVNAKVTKNAKVKTSFKIATPVATSSVRGTEEDVFYGPDNGMKTIPIENTLELEGNSAPQLVFGELTHNQSRDKGKPEPLNTDKQNGYENNLAENRSTDEERDTTYTYGDDLFNTDIKSDIDIVNEFYSPNADVTLGIQW